MVTDTCIVAGADIITAGAEAADIITAGGTTVRWNQLSSNIARAKAKFIRQLAVSPGQFEPPAREREPGDGVLQIVVPQSAAEGTGPFSTLSGPFGTGQWPDLMGSFFATRRNLYPHPA